MPRKLPIKCKSCGLVETTAWKYCPPCALQQQALQNKQWLLDNPDRVKEIERRKAQKRKLSGHYHRKYRRQRARLINSGKIVPVDPRKETPLLLECSRCKKMLPRGWFRRNGLRSNGTQKHHSHCRDCTRDKDSKHKAKRRGAGVVTVAKGLIARLHARQAGMCSICHRQLTRPWHVDHVVPVARGGRHEESNLALAHALCNLRKGAKLT